MKTDTQNCPPEADIETAFEKIHDHRRAIAVIEKPFDERIKFVDDEIETLIEDLMENRNRFESEKTEDTAIHTEAIAVLEDEIKEMVLENGKTCSTVFGTCTHVKGRKASVKWDDAALMGFVSAKPENEAILQFRVEGKEGKPSTRFNLVDLEV